MLTYRILIAGAIAGVLANVSGYLITGRLFHPYQSRTPDTWRKSESWTHYQYATAVRIAACIAIALLYGAIGTLMPAVHERSVLGGALFGAILWAVTILPTILEVSLFVNWHRGFIAGLLLDWLVVCVMAGGFAAFALRAV